MKRHLDCWDKLPGRCQ